MHRHVWWKSCLPLDAKLFSEPIFSWTFRNEEMRQQMSRGSERAFKKLCCINFFFFVDWFSSPSRGKMRMMLTKFKNAPKDIISKLMAHAIILLTINGRPRSSKEVRNCIPILCRNLASYTLNLYEENRNPIAALCDLVHPFPGRPEGT